MAQWTMLLVCSGNTCRSPMAEALARQLIGRRKGLKAEELEAAGVRVLSAGTSAQDGDPASPGAARAMAEHGLNLQHHRSRRLTKALVDEADLILCMTERHRDAVLSLTPAAAGKTHLLDGEGEIDDPFGADVTAYRQCAEDIRWHLGNRLEEFLP